MALRDYQMESSGPELIARMERLPVTSWSVRLRLIVGTATFFDAFDALAIAYVLPVLVPLWQLSSADTGLIIAMGYVGQLFGAILFGWWAERYGRLHALWVTVLIISGFSMLCAAAWNLPSLLVFRFLQGLGLGGEVPVAATYINELTKAKGRGKFVLLYELAFALGMTMVSLMSYWIVPQLGWHSLFLLGGLPAVITIFLRRVLPESPRWLIGKGRLAEAQAIVENMEEVAIRESNAPLAPIAVLPATTKKGSNWRELFDSTYRVRTLVIWAVWFVTSFVNYGVSTWLPTLFRTQYGLSLEVSLLAGVALSVASLLGTLACALVIDITGRKLWFTVASLLGGLLLVPIWLGAHESAVSLLVWASLSRFFITSNAVALYLYTPEIYPTRIRALGSSVASAWFRLASGMGPYVVGMLMTFSSVAQVFLVFATLPVIGGLIAAKWAIETKGKTLEEISP